jgi:dipeptidyl-peptidase-4
LIAINRRRALLFAAFSAFPLFVWAQSAPVPLTVEAIFAHGSLLGTPPEHLSWSPDGKHLTYEDGGELVDLSPGQESGEKPHVLVSRAKLAAINGAADSEKDRDHRERYKMAAYLWSPDASHLLFDAKGRLWLYDLKTGTGVEVGFTGEASGDDPKFSPNGSCISFLREGGLSVLHLRDPGTPTYAVAPSPNKTTSNGGVDWVYEEELGVRSNYFWSPDSKRLAYLQTNEEKTPIYPLIDWIPLHPLADLQRYPQPGDPNPEVKVGVVGASGGKTVWVKLPIEAGQDYIPRFGWADAKTLWIEAVTRDHKHRDLYFADASSGQARPALQLTDEKFFDEKYDVFVGAGAIVMTNWSDGHNHLYLYSYNPADPGAAKQERQLTQGEFEVADVYRVDADRHLVDYASNEGNPLERQLWEVSFTGERKPLTSEPGHHEGSFSPAGEAFADKFSTTLSPPVQKLCRRGGSCSIFWQTRALEPYRLRAPENLTVKAHDGTTLYATLLLPMGAAEDASVPLIVNPYGGPSEQTVANQWQGGLLFDTVLAQHGFAVLHADNRGMGNRGREFAQAAYHNFGPVQLEDQLTVIDAALEKYPQLNRWRMGWWGWSWGGSFTLYALSHSDRFRAGVAVAPVTDWRNYDSIYTERYMSLPAEFASGYRDFSVVNSAAKVQGRLLLVHGTGDDNVHMQNTVQYVQKLVEAGIAYDLQLYPRKTHSIAGAEARTHLFNRILKHFDEVLEPGTAGK